MVLDWTENPLIALYFAIKEVLSSPELFHSPDLIRGSFYNSWFFAFSTDQKILSSAGG